MGRLVVLCPGQGAQAVGMGREWHRASPEARAVFERADAVLGNRLGAPLSMLCFQGPTERLNRTDVSQPALFVTGVACWRGLLAQWGLGEGEADLAGVGGLSLGEYTALVVAGSIGFDEALELVRVRGEAMQAAAESSGGAMVALIGADEAQAEEICAASRQGEVLVCANFNAPGQVVVSGHRGACERAANLADQRGLRAAFLPVAGAFHSPLMEPAAERLARALEDVRIDPPRCPVVSNVTALPHEPWGGLGMAEAIRRRLVEQLTSPVRWEGCVRWLASRGPAEFHELAPGTTLAGLARRTDRSVKVVTHDTPGT